MAEAGTCPMAPGSAVRTVAKTDWGPERRSRVPGRVFATWACAFGFTRWGLRLGARRGDLLARMVVDQRLRADPFAGYDEVRAGGPVYLGRYIGATAKYTAANHVLRSDAFGVAGGTGGLPRPVERLLDRVADPGALGPLSPPSMLAIDPPEHTRNRRRVSRVFTPRAVARLESSVQGVADDLLDRITASGVNGFDLVERYASQLPVAVISDILGVPENMRQRVLEWGDHAAVTLDPDLSWRTYRDAEQDLRAMYGWFDEHVAYLREHPGEDLLSELAQLDGEDRLDDDEMRATGLLVLGAGFETTVNLISNAVATLDAHPDQLAKAQQDDLWGNLVEEVLRYESPVQLTLREAYRDTEVEGVRVPKGQALLVMLAGANRDPEIFADPHRFDVTRSNAGDHLAFSSGVHYCLGASLARMEATVGLRTLYERFPDLRLDGRPVRKPTRVLRGFERLPVRFERSRTA